MFCTSAFFGILSQPGRPQRTFSQSNSGDFPELFAHIFSDPSLYVVESHNFIIIIIIKRCLSVSGKLQVTDGTILSQRAHTTHPYTPHHHHHRVCDEEWDKTFDIHWCLDVSLTWKPLY